jgi:hypothetical protein
MRPSGKGRGRCHSIYFREPSGVMFEIATRSSLDAEEAPPPADRRQLSPRVDPRIRAAFVG